MRASGPPAVSAEIADLGLGAALVGDDRRRRREHRLADVARVQAKARLVHQRPDRAQLGERLLGGRGRVRVARLGADLDAVAAALALGGDPPARERCRRPCCHGRRLARAPRAARATARAGRAWGDGGRRSHRLRQHRRDRRHQRVAPARAAQTARAAWRRRCSCRRPGAPPRRRRARARSASTPSSSVAHRVDVELDGAFLGPLFAVRAGRTRDSGRGRFAFRRHSPMILGRPVVDL